MGLETNRGIYTPKASLIKLFKIIAESPKELKVSWNNEIFEGKEGLQKCEEKWNSI